MPEREGARADYVAHARRLERESAQRATEDMERPGIGAALCGLVGGGLGVAAGLELGALAALAMTAGANPAFTGELLGAVILGLGGAAAGIAAGQALETSLCDGLPKSRSATPVRLFGGRTSKAIPLPA